MKSPESFITEDKPTPEKPEMVSGMLQPGESPDAFVKKVEFAMNLRYGNIDVKGEDNLSLIPNDRHVIFAPTHLSNEDVPLAIAAIGQRFHLGVGDASTHRTLKGNPGGYIATKMIGEKNFHGVSHGRDEKNVERGAFNPADFDSMQNVFDNNKALMLSAYYTGREDGELPAKGGYGAVYAADLANAVIVPIAVNSDILEKKGLKNILKRPNAEIIIGKPLEFPKIEGLEDMKRIFERRQGGESSPEDKERFHALTTELRERSGRVMTALAELLPETKRGPWGKEG